MTFPTPPPATTAPTPSKPESVPKPPSCIAPPASDSASPSPGETVSVTISFSTTASASGAFKACPERATATEWVKCTESIRAHAYETRATYSIGKGRAVYTNLDIDFLIAHVVPLDIWYAIPVEVCTPTPMLRFYPHRTAKKMRLEKYREAWHQLKPTNPEPSGPITIHAVADETIYPDLDSRGAPYALSS